MSVEIRTATVHDFGPVLALWRAAGGPTSVSDSEEGLSLLLARDQHALLVAESDGAVIGTVIAAWDGWRGNLYRLAVHPERRRERIATALVREGERRLRARGALRLSAVVDARELAAVELWRSAGYEPQEHQARFTRHC